MSTEGGSTDSFQVGLQTVSQMYPGPEDQSTIAAEIAATELQIAEIQAEIGHLSGLDLRPQPGGTLFYEARAAGAFVPGFANAPRLDTLPNTQRCDSSATQVSLKGCVGSTESITSSPPCTPQSRGTMQYVNSFDSQATMTLDDLHAPKKTPEQLSHPVAPHGSSSAPVVSQGEIAAWTDAQRRSWDMSPSQKTPTILTATEATQQQASPTHTQPQQHQTQQVSPSALSGTNLQQSLSRASPLTEPPPTSIPDDEQQIPARQQQQQKQQQAPTSPPSLLVQQATPTSTLPQPAFSASTPPQQSSSAPAPLQQTSTCAPTPPQQNAIAPTPLQQTTPPQPEQASSPPVPPQQTSPAPSLPSPKATAQIVPAPKAAQTKPEPPPTGTAPPAKKASVYEDGSYWRMKRYVKQATASDVSKKMFADSKGREELRDLLEKHGSFAAVECELSKWAEEEEEEKTLGGWMNEVTLTAAGWTPAMIENSRNWAKARGLCKINEVHLQEQWRCPTEKVFSYASRKGQRSQQKAAFVVEDPDGSMMKDLVGEEKCLSGATSGSASSHINAVSAVSAATAKQQSLPVLQANQDPFGLLPMFLDGVAKKLNKAEELKEKLESMQLDRATKHATDISEKIKTFEMFYQDLLAAQTGACTVGAPSSEQKNKLVELYVKCTQADVAMNNVLSRAKGVKPPGKPAPKAKPSTPAAASSHKGRKAKKLAKVTQSHKKSSKRTSEPQSVAGPSKKRRSK